MTDEEIAMMELAIDVQRRRAEHAETALQKLRPEIIRLKAEMRDLEVALRTLRAALEAAP